MDNFKCPCCDRTYLVSKHTTKFELDEETQEYKPVNRHYKTRKELVCPNEGCKNTVLIVIEKSGIPSFGKFSSMSTEDRKKHLKERSTKHSQRFHNPKDFPI